MSNFNEAQASVATPDDRNLAMLTHLSGILFWFVVPLVMWLVHKDKPERAYLTDHAKEALNFQITVTIGYVVSSVLTVILIGFLMWFAVWLACVVLSIIAALKAKDGVAYRYPFALRLVS